MSMEWIIWVTILAVMWSNNEILDQHTKNNTEPSYKFWISVALSLVALIAWFIVRFK